MAGELYLYTPFWPHGYQWHPVQSVQGALALVGQAVTPWWDRADKDTRQSMACVVCTRQRYGEVNPEARGATAKRWIPADVLGNITYESYRAGERTEEQISEFAERDPDDAPEEMGGALTVDYAAWLSVLVDPSAGAVFVSVMLDPDEPDAIIGGDMDADATEATEYNPTAQDTDGDGIDDSEQTESPDIARRRVYWAWRLYQEGQTPEPFAEVLGPVWTWLPEVWDKDVTYVIEAIQGRGDGELLRATFRLDTCAPVQREAYKIFQQWGQLPIESEMPAQYDYAAFAVVNPPVRDNAYLEIEGEYRPFGGSQALHRVTYDLQSKWAAMELLAIEEGRDHTNLLTEIERFAIRAEGTPKVGVWPDLVGPADFFIGDLLGKRLYVEGDYTASAAWVASGCPIRIELTPPPGVPIWDETAPNWESGNFAYAGMDIETEVFILTGSQVRTLPPDDGEGHTDYVWEIFDSYAPNTARSFHGYGSSKLRYTYGGEFYDLPAVNNSRVEIQRYTETALEFHALPLGRRGWIYTPAAGSHPWTVAVRIVARPVYVFANEYPECDVVRHGAELRRTVIGRSDAQPAGWQSDSTKPGYTGPYEYDKTPWTRGLIQVGEPEDDFFSNEPEAEALGAPAFLGFDVGGTSKEELERLNPHIKRAYTFGDKFSAQRLQRVLPPDKWKYIPGLTRAVIYAANNIVAFAPNAPFAMRFTADPFTPVPLSVLPNPSGRPLYAFPMVVRYTGPQTYQQLGVTLLRLWLTGRLEEAADFWAQAQFYFVWSQEVYGERKLLGFFDL